MDFLKTSISDVVITHHGPNPALVHKEYRYSGLKDAFFTDCIDVYKYMNGVWIYGHTHKYSDLRVGHVRFVCNPIGYPSETTEAQLIKIIDTDDYSTEATEVAES
jgi:predicted phosphodiesterase